MASRDNPFLFSSNKDVTIGERLSRRLGRQKPKKAPPNKKSNVTPVGEKELKELMRQLEYEISHDPYRGLSFLAENTTFEKYREGSFTDMGQSQTVVKKIVTPWDVCQWGILTLQENKRTQADRENSDCSESDNGRTEDGSKILDPRDPQNLVRNLTESSCPSLLVWTQRRLEEEAKKKQQSTRRKRKNRSSFATNEKDLSLMVAHLGTRSLEPNYSCPCDYNPFCLGSMGGVINDVLKEQCKDCVAVTIRDDDEDAMDPYTADTSNPTKKRPKPDELESSNNREPIEIVDIETVENEGKPEKESSSSSSQKKNNVHGGDNIFSNLLTAAFDKFKEKTLGSPKTSVEDTQSVLLTCAELGSRYTPPATGNPAEVFTAEHDISDQHLDQTEYSQATKAEIDKLRRCETVDLRKIKRFVQEKINKFAPDEYIEAVIEWNKSLLFVDPTREERDLNSNQITLALPPGIQNLGATCYLNTQLQCLAQNPVFRDTIFSWRPINANHKMNGVMIKLQKLLAQMLVGGNRTYTSLDFSNALGIQHNEQQDPNEFARLLFDRMEESFQQCSTTGGGGLGRLLHRIFHGTTTYETICLKCGKTSVRSEGFMDLNLPIVQRQHDESDETDANPETIEVDDDTETKPNGDPAFVSNRKRRKTSLLESAFSRQRKKAMGTDVQYCFDQYTKAELLDGDNQYFCDTCNSKQDAKRVTKLTELPPVLNIQLSRYVFDREKFVKKKLMDKVRLPTVLCIDRYGNKKNSSSTINEYPKKPVQTKKSQYVLCAVMRHQGTSAYSGHYVAEAMDWTTGQWYEFNDETVTLLPSPSHSYIPDILRSLEDEEDEGTQKSKGSQDAYNMYYVDEDFLAKHASITMSRYKDLNASASKSSGNMKNPKNDQCILLTQIQEKAIRDSVLTDLCAVDYAISDRLRRRRDGIRKFMFVDATSLLIHQGRDRERDDRWYWVDSKTLRAFLACDRSLDNKIRSTEPMICPKTLLCPHGRLHPRTARQGKLLRKPIYDAYTSLVAGERQFLSASSERFDNDVVGCEIRSELIHCETCSESYCTEMSTKFDHLRSILELYADILDESMDLIPAGDSESEEDVTKDVYSYIVSRSTITSFKKLVTDLMKSVAGFEKGGVSECGKTSRMEGKNSLILNGVEDINLSCFPCNSTISDRGADQGDDSNASVSNSIDMKFNSKITCSHGNCNDFSKRTVRYVPYKTWIRIKAVFPEAIEHKILMYRIDGKMRKPNIEEDGCRSCREEEDAVNNLTSDIKQWAKETKENFALKKLLDGKKISPHEISIHNFDSANSNCRLVHRDDIANLCTSVKSLSRFSKAKFKIPDDVNLASFVENLAFPSYHSVVLDFEKQPSARLLQSLRSLVCCEHKRVIKSAIIQIDQNAESSCHRYQLSNDIAVLSEEEYNAYINSLANLFAILNRDHRHQHDASDVLQGSFETLLDEVKELATSCHPTIKMNREIDTHSDEILLFSLDGNSKEFFIVPRICDCETCKRDFMPLIQKEAKDFVDSVSVDSAERVGTTTKSSGTDTICTPGSVAMRPIVVESDLEDFTDELTNAHKLRVFRYSSDSSVSDALKSLPEALGLPSDDDYGTNNVGVRRSTRRRKRKFPIGCISHEDTINIGLHHNVAALRLLLYQNCQYPLGTKLGLALRMDDSVLPTGLEISFGWNEMALSDIIKDKTELQESSFFEVLKASPTDHLFLLCQTGKNGAPKYEEATMMDQMIQMSNMDSSNATHSATKGKGRKKNSSERGFQGTLLQSSVPQGLSEGKAPPIEENAPLEHKAEAPEVKSRVRSNTIVSDDDVDENQEKANNDETVSVSETIDSEKLILTPIPKRNPPRQVETFDDVNHQKKMRLLFQLTKLTDSQNDSACFEAITWAMNSSSRYTEHEMIDAALAKYFELVGGDR